MKKVLSILICALSIAVLLSACGEETLSNIPQEVGEVVVKEENVLPSANQIPSGGSITKPSQGDTQLQYELTSVEDIKSWLSGIVSGEYNKIEDGFYVTEQATMSDGGTVSIVVYNGDYQYTEFKYPASDTELLNKAEMAISTFVGRSITDNERSELQEAIKIVMITPDTGYISLDNNTCYITVILNNNEILFQCV